MMADPSIKMLNSLLQTVREDNTPDNLGAKISALSALGNIALLQDTHPAMLAPELELFKIMIRISREHELQPRQMAVKFLASMAKTATNQTVNTMVSSGILTLIAHLLKVFTICYIRGFINPFTDLFSSWALGAGAG